MWQHRTKKATIAENLALSYLIRANIGIAENWQLNSRAYNIFKYVEMNTQQQKLIVGARQAYALSGDIDIIAVLLWSRYGRSLPLHVRTTVVNRCTVLTIV